MEKNQINIWEEVLGEIKKERISGGDFVSIEMERQMACLLSVVKNESIDVRKAVVSELELLIDEKDIHMTIFLYSSIVNLFHDKEYLRKLIEVILEDKKMRAYTKYFLFYQIKSLMFRFKEFESEDMKIMTLNLFKQVVEMFSEEVQTNLNYIPVKERNENLILVITEQFIKIEHGPTKTALDRCKTLITQMGKNVLLMNTAEGITQRGKTAFAEVFEANYIGAFLEKQEMTWKGVSIPYFQCEDIMPDIAVLELLLQNIRELKPRHIVMIGGSGMLGNLADKMIPALAVGLCPSDLEFTTVSYQTLSKPISDRNRRYIKEIGKDETHIIQSVFTSGLKEQKEHFTREQLGIPVNKIALVVVGGRLDDEVTEEFLQLMNSVLQTGYFLVFVGRFEHYTDKVKQYENVKMHSKYLGFCQDILAVLECCDLYINPNRKGGGTSCVESLSKGKPVVSLNYGDVAVNVGDDFIVNDYSEMEKMIYRYKDDKEFYQEQSEKAIKRAQLLQDTDGEFVRIMKEFEQRERNGIENA